MDKTKITTFYAHQKRSTANIDDIKRLSRKSSLKKAEIVQCTLEKSVDSKSPVARNTRSSTRIKAKTALTRQSSKINDFFKSQTDDSDTKNDTPVAPNNGNEDDYVLSSSTTTLENKNCNSTEICDEQKSSPGFVTPIKSPPKPSPQKRRYNETVSLSNRVKNCTPDLSITTEEEQSKSTLQQSRSVRKKLSLGDDDYMKEETESLEDAIKKQKNDENMDVPNVTSCEFWDLNLSPLSKISRPISPLPETPQKLREMRQAAAVKPGTTSDKCIVNLSKILELPKGSGTPQINVKITKAHLAKCGKLVELQKHLIKMKELKEQQNLKTKAGKSPVKKSPVKSPMKMTEDETTNKTFPSPNKTDKAPAYERFKHLILPSVPSLTLPHYYTVLEDFFKFTDTVVSMLFNRAEVCTLTKVKAAVQEMAKRNFEAKILGQIKTVYPNAYEFKQEKGLPKCGYKYQGYQLTLTPLFDAINSKDASKEKIKFTSSDILRRQKIFHSNLVNMVKQKHKVFLQSLNLSIPEEKLTRWHPRFRLDQLPEIEPSPLPELPHVKVYQTAKDVLEDTKKRLHPKVKTALENVAAASTQPTTVTATTPESNSNKEALKGIPQGLLERIRAKEAQNLKESITRSPMQDKKIKMLDRLPEISRILRNYFVTEKKPALLFDDLLERISESYKSPISKVDAENHLKLLLEVAPTWITIANTMKGKYIKLDKTIKLQNIHEKINQYRKTM